jgi:hypothetical protein
MSDERLTASEAGVLAHAIDYEVEYLGWLYRTDWSREDFDAAFAKLRALAGEHAPPGYPE